MESGTRKIKIYPEMQEIRLLELIHREELELEQLKLLKNQYTILSKISEEENNRIMDDFDSIVQCHEQYNEALSMPESETIKIKRQNLKKDLNSAINKLMEDIESLKNDALNFRKIPSSIYKENRNDYIPAEQIIKQQKREIKVIFNKLIESNPEQSELLKFVSNQQLNPIEEIVKARYILHGQLDFDLSKIELLKSVYIMEIEQQILLKFVNAIQLKSKNLVALQNQLTKLKNEGKICENQIKRQQPQAIAPNIVIQNLYPYDSSEVYYCLEYHADDKSLFLNKFKIKKDNNKLRQYGCTDFARTKIEYILLENVSKFYEFTEEFMEFKKSIETVLTPIATRRKFFEEKRIKQILLDNKLIDKPDNVFIDINSFFKDNNIGFAAIKTAEGDKSFDKIIFFQDEVDKDDKSKKCLHVVECGELLSENYKAMFKNNKIKLLLKYLNCGLNTLFNDYNKKKQPMEPIDIIKNGKIFFKSTEIKIGSDSSKIKPYNKCLEMKYRPFNIDDQTENLDDDNVIKKHIERFMNIQNTLRNIHIAGGSTNTLLKMPYYCVDGLDITDNLPIIPFGHNIAASKIADGEDREDVIKQDRVAVKDAICKAINELVDKSLDIQL